MKRERRLLLLTASLFMFTTVALADPYEDFNVRYKTGDYDGAIAVGQEYLAGNPGDQKMWSSLVAIYDKQNNYKEVRQNALAYLEKHGNDRSKYTEVVEYYLAESWVRLGDYDLVEPFVTRLLTERPSHKYRNELFFSDAKASLWNKSYAKAYEKYNKLANADPNDGVCRKAKFYAADSAFMLAEDMTKNGESEDAIARQYQLALNLFEAFRKANIADKALWARTDIRFVQCYRKLHKYDSLDESIKSALSRPEHQANKGPLWFEQGESYFDRQQWDKALECYDSILAWVKLSPANAKTVRWRMDILEYHRVLCMLKTGTNPALDQAVIEFSKKYPASENTTRIAYAAALVPFNKENWAGSIETLKYFLQKNPNAPEELKIEAEFNAVSSMLLGNKSDQAKQYVQTKLAETPDYVGRQGLLFLSAMADYRSGKWPEASTALNKLIEQSPEGTLATNARLYIGICKLREARREKNAGNKNQVEALQQEGRKYLVDWAKNIRPAVSNEMDALYYQGDYAAIKDAATKSLEANKSDPAKKAQMLNWMGLVSINQNPPDIQSGKRYFDQAYQTATQDPKTIGSEAVKSSAWNAWIALYNDDPAQTQILLKQMKALPDSSLKAEAMKQYLYIM